MRVRHVLLVLVFSALAACAKQGTTSPSPSASSSAMSETTISKCVIDQGSTPAAKATGTTFSTIKPQQLTVGSDTAFPPFESIDKGKAVGFDVDLIDEIGKRIGKPKVEVQSAVFDTIFTALAAGKYDVVISAATIKADRKKNVDFTDPYFTADLSVTVRDKDAATIKGTDDLSGKILGTQSGTTSEDCAKNALKANGKVKDIRSYDTSIDAFTDLSAGRVDAVLIDLPTAKQVVGNRRGLTIVQVVRTQEQYGIAVSKKNPNLREAINKALAQIKSDGTYRRLFVKWFKTEPPA